MQHQEAEDVATPQLAAEDVQGARRRCEAGGLPARVVAAGDGLGDWLARLARHSATDYTAALGPPAADLFVMGLTSTRPRVALP